MIRKNPARLAWTVLFGSFLVFCTLAVTIPLGARWFLINATRNHEAQVTCLEGTVVVEDPQQGGARPVLKGETISVAEGVVLSVDQTAQAQVTFFDQSQLRLFPGTSVVLQRMTAPRFSASHRTAQISVYLRGGRLYANTVLRGTSPFEFTVESLQAATLLAGDGAYTLEVNNERSEVIVQRGSAEVTALPVSQGTTPAQVALGPRQRTMVELGKAPLAPLKAERDLMANGDFAAPLGTGWNVFNDQGGDGGQADGTTELVVDESRRAVRFYRTGGEFNHCETIIEQTLNRDLPDPLTTLRIRATVKLVDQSLSGGGYLSSEYPLMIKVRYRDLYGSEGEWIRGFYYQNLNNNPTMYGQQIPQGSWYFYESENLADVLEMKPYRILWVSVSASGWNYTSLVSEISLITE